MSSTRGSSGVVHELPPDLKKSAEDRSARADHMGGYTAGAQRVDLLDRVGEETGNQKPPDRMKT